MKTYEPAIGRPLPVTREQAESDSARAARLERASFYNSRRWRVVASLHLAREPICCWCGRLAEMVDHILPRLLRPDLAFTSSNLRSCCRACHARHGEKGGGGGGPRGDPGHIQEGHFA